MNRPNSNRSYRHMLSFSAVAAVSLLAVMLLANCTTGGSAGQDVAKGTGAYTAAEGAAAATLENLQTAFNGESNAHAKYIEYAKRADTEGYTKVASLFRAAARAEEIHAANHASVIKQLGGEPTTKIELPEIKTTKENLEDAVKGETYERDVMYTDFIKQARDTGSRDALRTFNFAKSAEAEHAKLYTAALNTLEDQKGGTTTYYVCPKCGFTTPNKNFEKCPVDFTPKEQFEAVS
jgi:rubrerythrin/predicted small secreted protein